MATQINRLDDTGPHRALGQFLRGLKGSGAGPGDQIRVSKSPATNEDPSPVSRPASRGDLAVEVDFAEMKDGKLVELVEDGQNPGRRRFAIWKDGEVRYSDRLEQEDGQVLMPPAKGSKILGCIRLPRGAESYGSAQELVTSLESLISQCIGLDEKYLPVLANFVLSTWFVDRFSVAPYLSVVGLPQSGKTTLLRLLSLVCRRSLLIADISPSSFYRACARFMPTILIDETGTAGNNRALRHMLRSGTTREVLAVRTDGSLHSYGAKVVSWLEPPDDPALNSRCILVPMFESKRTTLVGTEEPRIRQLAAHLQAQLLRFRLENFKTVQPVAVPGDEVLRPRTRDLLRTLTAGTIQDAQRSQALLKFFASGQALPSEPLTPEQNAVLHLLFAVVHLREEYSSIYISELGQKVNAQLRCTGENMHLQPRKIGAVLTSMGFSHRTRTNSGWTLQLTRQDVERIHQMVACYGIDEPKGQFNVSRENCGLCKATGLDKKEPAESTTAALLYQCRKSNSY